MNVPRSPHGPLHSLPKRKATCVRGWGWSIALLTALICGAGAIARAESPEPEFSAAEIEHFERHVRPLLHKHCYECHSGEAKTLHGSLRVDGRQHLLRGGDTGPAVIAGKPAASLLISAIQYDGDIQMPPEGKLSEQQIAVLVEWVSRGAPFPGGEAQQDGPRKVDIAEGRKFWSFQPLHPSPQPPNSPHPNPPSPANPKERTWARNRIDGFVQARLREHGLKPSPMADRATLARRLTFDLTGLPPTPEAIQQFAADESPRAIERFVEQLLANPAYGERWGRHWLDLARYTDVTATWLNKTGQAHLYRDWVVQALNDDVPYDDFVRRQLATDYLEHTGPEDLPALGLLGLSPTYWKELKLPAEIIKVIVADEWEERVDVVSRTFLGLTVACARCHDHKFDPITTRDYYALAGVFASCRITEKPLIDEKLYAPAKAARETWEQRKKDLAALQKKKPQPPKKAGEKEPSEAEQAKYEEAIGKHKEQVATITKQLQELRKTPHFDAPLAHVVADESLYVVRAGKTMDSGAKLDYRPESRDLPVFIRGNPNRHGEIVPRRYLEVLSGDSPLELRTGSGRLDLANAITQQSAPLAARVIVNRIWLEHFGRGIVETPSNFGQLGARPSHPGLLDDLAARFIQNGWSLKWLHREIVTSATYLQSSVSREAELENDPDNRWLWRMNRRRLMFEPWRDAMLSATGELDRSLGGPAQKVDDPSNVRRTLYASIHRRDMPQMLQIHDFPAPIAHSPRRVSTITPLQGLYVLNSDFIQLRAEKLSLQFEKLPTLAARVDAMHWRLLGRSATQQEQELAKEFLGEQAADLGSEAWRQYSQAMLGCNEFLFID